MKKRIQELEWEAAGSELSLDCFEKPMLRIAVKSNPQMPPGAALVNQTKQKWCKLSYYHQKSCWEGSQNNAGYS